MCGRFTLSHSGVEIAQHFDLPALAPLIDWVPRFNIAPSQDIAVVRVAAETGERCFETRRWGLLPGWAKSEQDGARLINARLETAHEKPAFREALRRRRCLVPADGFYEWKTEGRRKLPHHLSLSEGALFAMAGLYESWQDSEGRVVRSVAILTMAASGPVAAIHARMPVILAPQSYAAWLEPSWDGAGASERCPPGPATCLSARPVGKRVNDVRHDDASCLEFDPLPLFNS